MTSTLLRYWHTIRYLKPVQLYGRVLFRCVRPTPDLRPPPPVRQAHGAWVQPPLRAVSLIGPAEMHLLHQTRDITDSAAWSAADAPRLWLYNLHYFDDLLAPATDKRRQWQTALIQRWIAENPPGSGPGWEPYPTSLRIGNWVKWARSGAALPDGFAESLAVQARWLSKRIEHHLQANHLFVNGKALLIAGLWFDGAEADAWRAAGLGICTRELASQLHRDGGHVEGSPMYHGLFLEDLLDLVNLDQANPGVIPSSVLQRFRDAAAQMLAWYASMSHPDGDLSFFNDAALGVAPAVAALRAYAAALGVHPSDGTLSDSGYFRAERGDAVLIADVAPVGIDCQPGHAHADTLSFELSIGKHRVIVNSGTSTYDVGSQRAWERATCAHSTVTINGADSSEVWGGFRVARRARARTTEHRDDRGAFILAGTHDGYRAQPGHPTHERRWQLQPGQLQVTDRIRGSRIAVARYYLHPDVRPLTDGVLQLADGRQCSWRVRGATAQVVGSRWYPAFHRSIPNHCIELTFTGDECTMEFTW